MVLPYEISFLFLFFPKQIGPISAGNGPAVFDSALIQMIVQNDSWKSFPDLHFYDSVFAKI